MTTRNKDYVGVTGVTTIDEAKSVVSLMRGSGFTLQTEHIPMIGFQVFSKNLEDGITERNKRVTSINVLPDMLESVLGDAFTTIHYYTKERDKLLAELFSAIGYNFVYSAKLIGGIQINEFIPTPKQVRDIRSGYPELKIILQISPKSSEGLGDVEMAQKLVKDYQDVDYLILDSSRGMGIEFNTEKVTATYNMFRAHGIRSNIIFTGGFNGENTKEKISQLKVAVGNQNFSIDAEGGLRDRVGDGYGNDILNLKKVEGYLRGASERLL